MTKRMFTPPLVRPILKLTGLAMAMVGCSDQPNNPDDAPSPDIPHFQVDPLWPQELPNDWILGSVTGVFVDNRDHVWITHLPETLTPEETGAVQEPPIGMCCAPAPVVLELDPEGRLIGAWGDAESQDPSEFPRNPHGIFVDHNEFVWVGTHRHHRVMKFTRNEVTAGSHDPELLGGPAGIWVDSNTNEVFIADGYRNRRVIVFDGDTGVPLRQWGAYGENPVDDYDFGDRDPAGPHPRQFSTVHGITGSSDGLIYVADRRGNRIQVFNRTGVFLNERIIEPATRASGSAFVPVLSRDTEQRWLFLADGTNHKVWIMDRRDLQLLGEFGRGGRQVGQFLRPHGMSIDSNGNLYVGEASTGRRVQKFTLQ